MLSSNSLALKEWAVVVQALAEGKQTLLLRKGGLYERHGRFSTEPTEFFFFPTYVHQMEQGVVNEAAPELQTVLALRPAEDQLAISCYAIVAGVHWLDSLAQVAALAGLHCWTSETIEKRFNYKKPGLYLFLLRVYTLPHLYTLPMLKRYAGCRSWVELGEILSTTGAAPVLSDSAFAQQVNQVEGRLALS
jgi:hypothetical protein